MLFIDPLMDDLKDAAHMAVYFGVLRNLIFFKQKPSTSYRSRGGVTAVASGATIYDPAIILPTIDQAKALFDPVLTVNNTFSRVSPPTAVFPCRPPIKIGATST